MSSLSPETYKLILAGILFIYVFLSKLLVGRINSVGKNDIILAILELPVGIFFLSISMLIAILISAKLKEVAMPFFCMVLCFLAVSMILVSLWRKCQNFYDEKTKTGWVVAILFFNLFISISGLYYSGNELINSIEKPVTGSLPKTAKR